MSIYIKESDIPLTRTRKDLIRKFLRSKSIPSYTNETCTKLQCDGKGEDTKINAYRSVTDLHEIVCSRFPNTNLNAIIRIIFEIIDEDNSTILVWCNMIQKIVVKYVPNKGAKWISDYSRERYYTIKGVDGYSLKDFEDIKNNIENN